MAKRADDGAGGTTKPKNKPSSNRNYPYKSTEIPYEEQQAMVQSTKDLYRRGWPTLPPPPVGGGGEGAGPGPITWSAAYTLEGAPGWWRGFIPSEWTPETEFAAMVNALLPYMTPEDQRQLGGSLAQMFPDAFAGYSPEKGQYPPPPALEEGSNEFYYQSQKRATDILSALDRMKQATGKDESKLGPGYQYLRQIATALRDYGAKPGQAQMTRRQLMNFYATVDPLMSQGRSEELGAYGEIARAIAQPFFASGKLVNVGKTESGEWVFGKPNTGWF